MRFSAGAVLLFLFMGCVWQYRKCMLPPPGGMYHVVLKLYSLLLCTPYSWRGRAECECAVMHFFCTV